MMQKNDKHFYLPTLDGWRAISILMVMVYHASWFKLGPETLNHDASLWRFFQVGVYGVSTFFTISGYLITSRILFEFKKYGSFNLRDFYIKRFFRIFPPFYFYLIVLMILNYIFDMGSNKWDLISAMSFLRIYRFDSADWYTAHIWSLCVEEHFYIILSFYFFLWGNLKTKWYILASLLGIILWNIISFRYKEVRMMSILIQYFRVFSWMDYMFVGSSLAFFSGNFEKTRKLLMPYQIIILVMLFPLFYLNFHFKTIVIPCYVGGLIYLTTLNPHRWVLKIFENGVMRYVGKISYSLYLWQQLFLVTQKSFIPQLAYFQTFPLNILFILIIAIFSYKYVEQPLIKYGRKFVRETV